MVRPLYLGPIVLDIGRRSGWGPCGRCILDTHRNDVIKELAYRVEIDERLVVHSLHWVDTAGAGAGVGATVVAARESPRCKIVEPGEGEEVW